MIKLNDLFITLDNWQLTASLTVEQGHFCALIGPSGAGKSTILGAIAGFVPHRASQLFIDGQDMAGLAPAERPVSMLFQEHNLFAHMTIAQNVALGINPKLKLGKADRGKVMDALASVGMADYAERLPRTLSGGQRQRASLARAILRQKPVLLLDEPFAALGPALRKEMLALVQSLARRNGQTVLMVTHHPEDAKLAANHVALVHDGTLAQAGATDLFFANPSPALRAYLG